MHLLIHLWGGSPHMWPDKGRGQRGLYSNNPTKLFPCLRLRSIKGCVAYISVSSWCFQFGFRSVHFNIYLLTVWYTYCTLTHTRIFGFFVHHDDHSVSVCILCKIHIQFASWTSVQISNIDYKYLLACQPEVHSPLNMFECCCFYIKLQLCIYDFIYSTRLLSTFIHTYTIYNMCYLLTVKFKRIIKILWLLKWLGVQVACHK